MNTYGILRMVPVAFAVAIFGAGAVLAPTLPPETLANVIGALGVVGILTILAIVAWSMLRGR